MRPPAVAGPAVARRHAQPGLADLVARRLARVVVAHDARVDPGNGNGNRNGNINKIYNIFIHIYIYIGCVSKNLTLRILAVKKHKKQV